MELVNQQRIYNMQFNIVFGISCIQNKVNQEIKTEAVDPNKQKAVGYLLIGGLIVFGALYLGKTIWSHFYPYKDPTLNYKYQMFEVKKTIREWKEHCNDVLPQDDILFSGSIYTWDTVLNLKEYLDYIEPWMPYGNG